MMPLWIPITLVAALCQTWRTALQQKLRRRVSVGTAGLVRFLYAIPVGLVLLTTYVLATHAHLPRPTPGFLLGCVLGGVAQIIGTALLIMAFGYRNFAVGTAYSKTDAIQAAIVSALFFGENLPLIAWGGVLVSIAGLLVLSLAGRGLDPAALLRATVQPAALCGVGAGTGLALAAVGIKAATLAQGGPDPILAALMALVVTNTLQTLIQGAWMAWREPSGLRDAFTAWRSAAWVGALSGCGSGAWFAAFALAPVALVRTLGQAEIVLVLLFSRYYLHETLRRAEIAGLSLVVLGVGIVLAVH